MALSSIEALEQEQAPDGVDNGADPDGLPSLGIFASRVSGAMGVRG
jgi:hypothetical protein